LNLLRWIVLPPVVLVTMALAVANRHIVTFSLDPFDTAAPAIALEMPLAAIVLIALFVGILIGGFAAWSQARIKLARRNAPPPPERPKASPATETNLPAATL